MKKYMLFVYDYYYPTGGMNDLTGSYDTIDECYKDASMYSYTEFQIIDRDTFKVVRSKDRLNNIFID